MNSAIHCRRPTWWSLAPNWAPVCDTDGRYTLDLPAGIPSTVRWSYTGLIPEERTYTLTDGERSVVNISLKLRTLGIVDVEGQRRREREEGVTPIDPRIARFNPNPQGGVEVASHRPDRGGHAQRTERRLQRPRRQLR
jgi:hypothetical protein